MFSLNVKAWLKQPQTALRWQNGCSTRKTHYQKRLVSSLPDACYPRRTDSNTWTQPPVSQTSSTPPLPEELWSVFSHWRRTVIFIWSSGGCCVFRQHHWNNGSGKEYIQRLKMFSLLQAGQKIKIKRVRGVKFRIYKPWRILNSCIKGLRTEFAALHVRGPGRWGSLWVTVFQSVWSFHMRQFGLLHMRFTSNSKENAHEQKNVSKTLQTKQHPSFP